MRNMSYTLKNNFMRDFAPTRPSPRELPLAEMIKLIRDPVKLAKLREYILTLSGNTVGDNYKKSKSKVYTCFDFYPSI